MILELGSWRCRRELGWSIAVLGQICSSTAEIKRGSCLLSLCVRRRSWRQTKIRWSISFAGPTTSSRRWQDPRRITHRVGIAGYIQGHEYRDIKFCLRPSTYWNLQEINWRCLRLLFWDIGSAKFIDLHLHLLKIIVLFMFRVTIYRGWFLGSTIHLCTWHFWGLSICNRKRRREGRGCSWKKTRKVCPAYVRSGIQIVGLFGLTKDSWQIEWNNPHHLHCTRPIDTPDHPKGFLSSDSCIRILLRIYCWVTCVCTFWRWLLLGVLRLRPWGCSIRDRIFCRSLRRKADGSLVYLSFYVWRIKIDNCTIFFRISGPNCWIILQHFAATLDFSDNLFTFWLGIKSPYLL